MEAHDNRKQQQFEKGRNMAVMEKGPRDVNNVSWAIG